MTPEQARENIGQQFRLSGYGDGLLSRFDTIRLVTEDGKVYGDFIEAHAHDCQLKQEQPEQLKKSKHA